MKPKFVILVVIYKQTLNNCKTITSLKSCFSALQRFNTNLVIWDNSENDDNRIFLDELKNNFHEIDYINTPENTSLSVVYNKTIKANINADYILLLDQDSLFGNNFIDIFYSALNEYSDNDLFLPIVKSGNTIVSPGNYFFVKGRFWKKVKNGLLPCKNTVAILSGMIIRLNFFRENNNALFDERLRFYGIDTSFMLKYQKLKRNLVVLDYVIAHDSQLLNFSDTEIALERFRILKSSWAVIHSDNILKMFFSKTYTFYVSLKYAMKFHDVRFLY